MQEKVTELRSWLTQPQVTTEKAMENAIAVFQDAAATITQLQAVQSEAKLLIGEIFAETGSTEATTPAGRVIVTKPGFVVTYDSRGLDALAGNDDELAGLLAPFRRQTERAGTLTIRALGNGNGRAV